MAFAYFYNICSSSLSDVEEVHPIHVPPSSTTNTILHFLQQSHINVKTRYIHKENNYTTNNKKSP